LWLGVGGGQGIAQEELLGQTGHKCLCQRSLPGALANALPIEACLWEYSFPGLARTVVGS